MELTPVAGAGKQHIAWSQSSLLLIRRIVIPTLWNIFLNQDKDGFSFEEARAVFYDDHALEYCDPDHSQEEDRFILLGMKHSHQTVGGLSLLPFTGRNNQDYLRTKSNQQ